MGEFLPVLHRNRNVVANDKNGITAKANDEDPYRQLTVHA